ncbi:MAG: T9SS type A sorting domain-containing protein [Candidatus Hatepunaea meridiana]|nr:T9SS type A sorting domain-containing protein [Candidatus Hatepunaea meridiana]
MKSKKLDMQKSNLIPIKTFLWGISVLFIIALPFSLIAQTEVEGEVSGVWDANGGPYRLIGDIEILDEDTLIVNHGVTIEFTENGVLELNGTLIINGQERDSVRFIGYDSNGYIFNENEQPSDANFISSFIATDFTHYVEGSYNNFSVTNSTLKSFSINVSGEFILANNHFDYPIIGNDDDVFITSRISGPCEGITFENNYFGNQIIHATNLSDFIFRNNIGGPIIEGGFRSIELHGDNIEAYSNSGIGVDFFGDNHIIHNNEDFRCALVGCVNTLVENNTFSSLAFGWSPIRCTIRNNRIGGLLISGEDILFERNIVVSGDRIQINGDVNIANNVFVSLRDLHLRIGRHYHYYGFSESVVRNNIFYACHPGRLAFREGVGEGSGYNCFFGFDSISGRGRTGEHNVIADPRFVGGNPCDYSLRHNSPCIDAGDPELGEDPDDTNPDIGAFFYNQNIDHPPSITSRWWDYAGNGRDFSYRATADDDGEDIDFSFEGLPDWLQPQNNNNENRYTDLFGEVPDDQEDFVFIITVTDDNDCQDTLSVSVDCHNATILRGSISGVLESDNSPYAVVENIYINEDESLVISPDVDIIYQTPNEYLYTDNIRTYVYGKLCALGEPDQPVHIYPDSAQALITRTNYYLTVASNDSFIFRNTILGNFFWRVDSSQYFELSNSSVPNADDRIHSNSNILIENCYAARLRLYADSIFVRNCVLKNVNSPSGLLTNADYIEIIDNNLFFTTDGISVWANEGRISHNLICEEGISIQECDQIQINSNTIINCSHDYGIFLRTNNYSVYNNIVSFCRTGITFSGNPEGEFYNNLISSIYEIPLTNPPESVGIISTVNENGDSTDTFGNLFQEAHLLKFGPRVFAPSSNSPAVDAGSDDLENDADDSPPDIGYYTFDHRNINPHIGGGLDNGVSPNEWVQIHGYLFDPDSDTLYYRIQSQNITICYDVRVLNNDMAYFNDSTMFNEPGEYAIIFEVTDGNDMFQNVRIVRVGNSGIESEDIPIAFRLYPAYPNPFNSITTIGFDIPVQTDVSIEIFDLQGRRVNHHLLPDCQIGSHRIPINGNSWCTGAYILKLSNNEINKYQKLVLVR